MGLGVSMGTEGSANAQIDNYDRTFTTGRIDCEA